MASGWGGFPDGDLNALLSTLLEDVVPMSSIQTMPLPQWLDSSLSTPSHPSEAQQGMQGHGQQGWHTHGHPPGPVVTTVQGKEGSAGNDGTSAEPEQRKPAPKRSSSSRSGNKGVRLRQQEVEQQLRIQQEQLKQQLSRRLYLTERVAMLEQLIYMRDLVEDLLQKIQAGLTYNPFAAFNTDVQSFGRTSPDMVTQRFIAGVQSLASRLATIGPLLQKYPQLSIHRPPHPVLNQLMRELSLAEPTNPYGADGLPVGSLTIPVPPDILAKFAAAYSLDLSSMPASDVAMLETCAILVIEQWGLTNAYRHAFFMLPQLHLGSALHVQEARGSTSWADVTAILSRLTTDDTSGSSSNSMLGGDSGIVVAKEEHWKNVVFNVGLTDKQKLQAAILWEIISGARNNIHAQRASLAQKLSQLLSPAVKQQESQSTSSGTTVSEGSHSSQGQGSRSSGSVREQDQHERAVAALSCTSEQLTQRELLMQRLNATLFKERLLMNLANAVMYAYILGVVQVSKVAVHSYPFLPGHQAILTCCAAECTPAVMDRLLELDSEVINQ